MYHEYKTSVGFIYCPAFVASYCPVSLLAKRSMPTPGSATPSCPKTNVANVQGAYIL